MPRPDRSFINRLHSLDPKLGCMFNRDIECFVITYDRAVGPPAPILAVRDTLSGGFRAPDQRDIITLQEGDLARESMESRLNKSAKRSEELELQAIKKRRENIRDWTKDDKIQLMRATGRIHGRGGKAVRPFRQIPTKARGKVF